MLGVQGIGPSSIEALRASEVLSPKATGFSGILKEVLSPNGVKRVPFFDLICDLSLRYGVHPALVLAVVKAESGFNSLAISPKGAMGLMQLMPQTAEELGVRDPFDPYQNLEAGIRYLKKLLERFGDPLLAIAAYNCGPQKVLLSGGIPAISETVRFVEKVVKYVQEFLESLGWTGWDKGKASSPKEEKTFEPIDGEEGIPSVLGTGQKEERKAVVLKSASFPLPEGQKVKSQGNPPIGEAIEFTPMPSAPIQRNQRAETEATIPGQSPIFLDKAVKELLTAVSVSPKDGVPKGEKRVEGGLWAFLLQGAGGKDVAFFSGVEARVPLTSQAEGAWLKEVVGELVERVKLEFEKGGERVEIELKPLVLGGLKVEVKKEAEGLSTHITAYTEETKKVLEAHLSEVQRAFESNGLKVTSLSIELVQAGEPSRRYGQREKQRRKEERRLGQKDQRVFEVVV